MSGSEFGTGKTIFVLAIVVGCFAVLWPKVFYPMLTSSMGGSAARQGDAAATAPTATPAAPRSERPSHLHPEMMHPALREKGRALPQRTIDKQARPGPMPGVRPPMGAGAGHIASPQQGKGAGSMSVIMPLYTVGIIIFFIYTIMKVLFKKSPEEEDKTPKLKDFHLDPEYRKYVFAEEYLDSGADVGSQQSAPYSRRIDQREGSTGLRRRVQPDRTEPKIGEARRMDLLDLRPSRTDTHGRKLEDEQMDQLRRRLEDTEKAMERLMSQMGSVSDKLTAAKITEVLSQAQAQAKLLKNESSVTVSSKGSSPDMDEYEVIQKASDGSIQQHSPKSNQSQEGSLKQPLPSENDPSSHTEQNTASRAEDTSDAVEDEDTTGGAGKHAPEQTDDTKGLTSLPTGGSHVEDIVQ